MFAFKLVFMVLSVTVLSICWVVTLSSGSGASTVAQSVQSAGVANVLTLVLQTVSEATNLFDLLYTTRPACGNTDKPELGGVEMTVPVST